MSHGILKKRLSESLIVRPTSAGVPIKTKIVCTIGPACNSPEKLGQLISTGLRVARFNFSHGDHESQGKMMANVREAAKKLERNIGIMLDTKGPEIRTGKLSVGSNGTKNRQLEAGNKFTFTTDESVLGNDTQVAVTYKNLPKAVDVGKIILVNDGALGFVVDKVNETTVECTIKNSGELGETKGVNLPGMVVDLPAVTEKDKRDIQFGVEQKVDFIAASFIRKAADVREIRNLPGVRDAGIKIISKIESQEGLDNFDEILEESDGIMVARGDLGVEIPIEKVCIAQKMMIQKCNAVGKPVITATQMLDSMERRPRPTRAEATDVANAVFDGTDCVMLSGETANGNYPQEAVATMANIAAQAELNINYRNLYKAIRRDITPPIPISESIASSAVKTAWDLQASLIIVLSESGNTARLISSFRPHCPILMASNYERVCRQMQVCRGVYVLKIDDSDNTEKFQSAMKWAKKQQNGLKSGDTVVLVSGVIQGVSGSTNILKVEQVE